MVRFIHTADLHLDSPFKGLTDLPDRLLHTIHNSSFESFKKIIAEAITKEVDFILIVGDLFELNTRSIKAQSFLVEQFKRLEEHAIQVFITYGNHDYILDTKFYLQFPDNVYIFNETVETTYFTTKNHERVALTGFSYHSQHITQNMMNDFPNRSSEVDYHIGLYHGDQFNHSHHYAPFKIGDIQGLHYHYFALGHIHKRHQLILDYPAYYSGNIQGRHVNEPGDKGALCVELKGSNYKVDYLSTSVVNWHTLHVSVDTHDTIDSLVSKVHSKLPNENKTLMIKVIFSIKDKNDSDLVDSITPDSLNQLLMNDSIWIYKTQRVTENRTVGLETSYPNSYKQITESFIHNEIDDYLNTLGKQVPEMYLGKYRDSDTHQDLIEKAKELLNTNQLKG